jgi:hypothetical protein
MRDITEGFLFSKLAEKISDSGLDGNLAELSKDTANSNFNSVVEDINKIYMNGDLCVSEEMSNCDNWHFCNLPYGYDIYFEIIDHRYCGGILPIWIASNIGELLSNALDDWYSYNGIELDYDDKNCIYNIGLSEGGGSFHVYIYNSEGEAVYGDGTSLLEAAIDLGDKCFNLNFGLNMKSITDFDFIEQIEKSGEYNCIIINTRIEFRSFAFSIGLDDAMFNSFNLHKIGYNRELFGAHNLYIGQYKFMEGVFEVFIYDPNVGTTADKYLKQALKKV